MGSKVRAPLFAVILASTALAITPAHAEGCSTTIDDISKAISGQLNMSADKKASMLRMALSGYDYCMVGDAKSSDSIRAMLMTQLRENLGGK